MDTLFNLLKKLKIKFWLALIKSYLTCNNPDFLGLDGSFKLSSTVIQRGGQ